MNSEPLPTEVKIVSEAIVKGDAQSLASHSLYPIERPYPLRNIEDSAQMVSYFPVMFDDSIKSVLATASREDWSKAGWRGWTLDAGQYLWIEEGLYAVPYLSSKEKNYLGEAVRADLATLPVELGNGWKPVDCFQTEDGGKIYRLDVNDSIPEYRLLEYNLLSGEDLQPIETSYGNLETQGSEGNRVYLFKDSYGKTTQYSADDTGEGLELMINSKGKHPRTFKVVRTYWLEKLHRR